MKSLVFIDLIVGLFVVFAEVVLKASNFFILENLYLINIFLIALLIRNKTNAVTLYAIFGLSLIEIMNYQVIGISSLVFFISLLVVNLIFNLVPILNKENLFIKFNSLICLTILFHSQLINAIGGEVQISLFVILGNAILLTFVLLFIKPKTGSSYVYKK